MLDRFRSARKSLWLTLVLFCIACLQSQYAHSEIVTTESLMLDMQEQSLQSTLKTALDRDDVVKLLEEHGVSQEQAQLRVAAMTDAEAKQLAAHFDELPAGGDVTLLLVVIILVLLLR